MRNKGFTLIELLAVIVILAIIALIAVPIVINIINDARESGYKRSIDNYGKAVEQAIATYQIYHPNDDMTREYNTTSLEAKVTVNYEGSRVVCSNIIVYEDGKIYMSGCSVGGHSVDYTYGIEQVAAKTGPDFYSWGSGNIGGSLPGDADTDLSNINTHGRLFYLGLDTANRTKDTSITAAYVCFKRSSDGEPYCLRGGVASQEVYELNQEIISSAFSNEISTSDCSLGNSVSYCDAGGIFVGAYLSGEVSVSVGGSASCYLSSSATFGCDSL